MPGVSNTTTVSSLPRGESRRSASASSAGQCSTRRTRYFEKNSGSVRRTTMRFSILYDTPDGVRRLSPSTRYLPSASRTRSMPEMRT